MDPSPSNWLAACIADLTPDLQVFLSWGSTVMRFHSWLSFSLNFFLAHVHTSLVARALHITIPVKLSEILKTMSRSSVNFLAYGCHILWLDITDLRDHGPVMALQSRKVCWSMAEFHWQSPCKICTHGHSICKIGGWWLELLLFDRFYFYHGLYISCIQTIIYRIALQGFLNVLTLYSIGYF